MNSGPHLLLLVVGCVSVSVIVELVVSVLVYVCHSSRNRFDYVRY